MIAENIELRPIAGPGFRFAYEHHTESRVLCSISEGEPCYSCVSEPLYWATPRAEIDLADLPTAEDTWRWMEDAEVMGSSDDAERWVFEEGSVGTVYFIAHAESGLIKVGYTASMEKRLRAYREHTPGLMEVYTMPGNRRLERLLLQRFRPVRRQGEWFYPHPALIRLALECI